MRSCLDSPSSVITVLAVVRFATALVPRSQQCRCFCSLRCVQHRGDSDSGSVFVLMCVRVGLAILCLRVARTCVELR
eukprot:7021191-Alexandrium_andersonii.AAC.1